MRCIRGRMPPCPVSRNAGEAARDAQSRSRAAENACRFASSGCACSTCPRRRSWTCTRHPAHARLRRHERDGARRVCSADVTGPAADLLRFCRANPHSRQSPGRIEMYAPCRFGRLLDEDKQPDLTAYQQLYAELTKLGWIPQFVTVKNSGNALTDVIQLVLHAHQDACAHARPNTRHGDDAYERFRAAGCNVWYIDAHEIELKIKLLIVSQRANPEFEVEVKGILLKKEQFSTSSAAGVASAKKNLQTKQRAYERAARTIAAIIGSETETVEADTVLTEQLKTLRHQVAVAEGELKAARRHADSGERSFAKLVSLIHETRNVAKACDRVGHIERRTIWTTGSTPSTSPWSPSKV